jgi:FixJ family two-component response regulator
MQKRVTTVAVVDDDPSMLKAAADLLDARGFSASLFTSAEEFLDSGEAAYVDCLVLDIHLGGLSGELSCGSNSLCHVPTCRSYS